MYPEVISKCRHLLLFIYYISGKLLPRKDLTTQAGDALSDREVRNLLKDQLRGNQLQQSVEDIPKSQEVDHQSVAGKCHTSTFHEFLGTRTC